jgi:hypothetical protein
MGTFPKLTVWAIAALLGFLPVGNLAVSASFETCVAGYNNVKSAAYERRFHNDAAAWAVKCPENWADKYRDIADDGAMMSDPCYGDPPICSETLGITPTYFECSGIAADKLGTPEQIEEADKIASELQETRGNVCHFAQ